MTDRYATLRNGLVGAWCPSLGSTGLRLTDYSPYRRDATISGSPVWRGDSIDLSASSTFAEIPHSPIYDPTTSGLSVSAWFTTTTTSLNFADVIISKVTGASPQYQFSLQGNGTGVLAFVLQNTSSVFFVPSASNISANRLYHFAGTFDGQVARAYLNGALTQSVSFSGTIATNTENIRISDTVSFTGRQWPGLLDDIRVYNRGLTQSEVAILASRRGIGLVPTRHRRGNVLGSQFHLNVGGTWKKATPWIRVNGAWTKATPKIRVSGAYK